MVLRIVCSLNSYGKIRMGWSGGMKIFNVIGDAEIIQVFYEKTGGIKIDVLLSYAYLKGNGVKITKTYYRIFDFEK